MWLKSRPPYELVAANGTKFEVRMKENDHFKVGAENGKNWDLDHLDQIRIRDLGICPEKLLKIMNKK